MCLSNAVLGQIMLCEVWKLVTWSMLPNTGCDDASTGHSNMAVPKECSLRVCFYIKVIARSRFAHISWVNFRDTHVNWNEELSLRAVCEECGDVPDLTYSWDLFLVNATEKSTMEGKMGTLFCW